MRTKLLKKLALPMCAILLATSSPAFAAPVITPYSMQCGNCRTGYLQPYSIQTGRTDTTDYDCVYECTYTEVKAEVETGTKCTYCNYTRKRGSTYVVTDSYHSREHD